MLRQATDIDEPHQRLDTRNGAHGDGETPHIIIAEPGSEGRQRLGEPSDVAPDKCTPLHTHPEAEETFYLLAGSVRLHISGTETELRTGGVAVIPRNVPHAFLAGSDGARMLCLHTPGGGENLYRTASEPARAGEPPLSVDFDRIQHGGNGRGQHARDRATAIPASGPAQGTVL